jgi:uncharacterized spore protein YtfJ
MDLFDPGRAVADLLSVRQVFGEPVRQDGVTVIPVARVLGGGGGGSGSGPTPPRGREPEVTGARDEASGSGGGLGGQVKPLGVYVLRGTEVTWQPVLDLQRIILGGQALGALAVLTVLVGLLRRRR